MEITGTNKKELTITKETMQTTATSEKTKTICNSFKESIKATWPQATLNGYIFLGAIFGTTWAFILLIFLLGIFVTWLHTRCEVRDRRTAKRR